MTIHSTRKRYKFLVKGIWRGTALRFYVMAKNEDEAWDLAANRIKRMYGGMSCLEIVVIGVVE